MNVRVRRRSWTRVNPTFSSAEFATSRELTMPSEITQIKACRSRHRTVIGRTFENSALLSPSSVMSISTASCSVTAGAGEMRCTSLAQRLIVPSSRNAAFCVRVLVRNFLAPHAICCYHDGKAVGRAPVYFGGSVEEFCSRLWSALLDKIGLESNRCCTVQI